MLGCGVGAADPARGVSVDHEAGDALIERVLSVAIESTPARSGAGSPNGGARVRRRGLLVLVVVLALLVAAAAALAAVGVIKLGADLDANDRLFDTVGADVVPASADGESDPSLGIGAVLSLRHASARCPAADLRQLSYGLLGPDARSLTYTLAGHRHTLAPSGPEGAYLIVSTPPCGRRAQSTGASLMPLPWDSPVDTISYSNGTICNIARTQPGKGPEDKLSGQCKPPGYVPLGASAPTHAQVAAAIHATLVTVPPAQVSQLVSRRAIRVSFTARVAVTKAASAYELVESTSSPLAVFVETQKDIAVGQTVSWLLPAPRPGTYSGTVTLGIGVPPAYPIYSYSPGPLVGRFNIRVP